MDIESTWLEIVYLCGQRMSFSKIRVRNKNKLNAPKRFGHVASIYKDRFLIVVSGCNNLVSLRLMIVFYPLLWTFCSNRLIVEKQTIQSIVYGYLIRLLKYGITATILFTDLLFFENLINAFDWACFFTMHL